MTDTTATTTPPTQPPGNPIIEAVVDIECELRPGFDLAATEAPATAALGDSYPTVQKQVMLEQQVTAQLNPSAPPQATLTPVRSALIALRLQQADGKQIVQIRASGYSFNRLAAYTSFDDYAPEIRRTWELYCRLVEPVRIRQISLRYINRIELPFDAGKLDLDRFLALGPRLADESRLTFTGFLHQHSVLEPSTGNLATITLTPQPQAPGATHLPIILDIAAHRQEPIEVGDWTAIHTGLSSLRSLNNHIFHQSLTVPCRQLYPSLP